MTLYSPLFQLTAEETAPRDGIRSAVGNWEKKMRWYRRLFWRARTERQLDVEFRFHLDQQIADYVAAGMTPEEARRRARLEFGGLDQVKEECRDVGAARLLETLVQDIRYGFRQLRRSPLLTAQFSITITIGMGATAAVLSLMLALGYQPLPYKDPGRLVAIWERADFGGPVLAISGPDLADFTDGAQKIFASLGAFWVPRFWLFDQGGATKVRTCSIQASAFTALGIRPVLGRGVQPGDTPLIVGGAEAPVWISYRLWQTRYGGRPSVIGTTIAIASTAAGSDKVPLRIVGVLPHGVSISLPFMENRADVWFLLSHAIVARSRKAEVFFGVGRLRPGVSVAEAQAALAIVTKHLAQRYSFDRGKRPVVLSLEAIAQGPARRTMGLLALGIGLVFLVGCRESRRPDGSRGPTAAA
jgi:putative ABC transport system permease protein